jgi:hypothetical protein
MAFTKDGIKKLAAHHGLDPENDSDSDIENCLKNSVSDDEMTELANRALEGQEALKTLSALRESQAKTDLKTYANRIGEGPEVEAVWKPQFLANRDATIKAIEKLPAVKPQREAPLHNRAGAGNPAPIENGGNGRINGEEVKDRVFVRNRAQEILRNDKKEGSGRKTFTQAFAEAQQELAAKQ